MAGQELPLFWYLVHYPMQLLAVATLMVMACRVPVKNWWAWTVTVAGLMAFAIGTSLTQNVNVDALVFWTAGSDIWAGLNPYDRPGCLNPPQAFALYALLALAPWHVVSVGWIILNAVGCAVLPILGQRALRDPAGCAGELPAPLLGVISAVLVLSVPCRFLIFVGQASLLIALFVLLVVHAYVRYRPVQAGLGLALASIKPQTMLPFLLLFLHRRHLMTWITLAVAGFGMYFAANPAGELFTRLQDCMHNIGVAHQPGALNDYPYRCGTDLIALNRAIHYLGITDRPTVSWLQYGVLLLLGAGVGWTVRGPRPWPAAAACSLASLYACIFLYHRVYDLVLLALPVVYIVGMARGERSAARWLYVAALSCIIGVWYVRIDLIKTLTEQAMSATPPPQWILALLIPHPMWSILGAMGFLAAAERWRPREQPAHTTAAVALQRIEMPWQYRRQRTPREYDISDRQVALSRQASGDDASGAG